MDKGVRGVPRPHTGQRLQPMCTGNVHGSAGDSLPFGNLCESVSVLTVVQSARYIYDMIWYW